MKRRINGGRKEKNMLTNKEPSVNSIGVIKIRIVLGWVDLL